MDDQRFDALAKRVGTSRRSLLKKMVGLGGAVVAVSEVVQDTEAARRGYAGPGGPSNAQCLFGTRRCNADGCCVCCDREHADDLFERFNDCYNDKAFCTRPYASCCEFCAGWAGYCIVVA
jgi:hypothetical protein